MHHATSDQPTELPRLVRLFPLDGVILLPRVQLPLQIFEPRYLAMVQDALASDQMIAIIQPRDDRKERPALYEVGTLGRITTSSETGDGRLLVSLSGVNRFRLLTEHITDAPWREGEADYAPFANDRNPTAPLAAASRADLESTLRHYLAEQEMSADWNSIHAADDESLVNSLSSVCPFSPAERQALLESRDFATRASVLSTLMRFADASAVGGGLQ